LTSFNNCFEQHNLARWFAGTHRFSRLTLNTSTRLLVHKSCHLSFQLYLTFQQFLITLIDHHILLSRISCWFGIRSSDRKCFKSYVSCRTFRVICDDNNYFAIFFDFTMFLGSVLDILLFIVYKPLFLSLFLSCRTTFRPHY